jgi:K+/H+ antiporter YhaU regulatory subunit KhtT
MGIAGVTIAGILRKGQLIANPGPDFILALADRVGVIGKRDQLGRFCELSNSLGCEMI